MNAPEINPTDNLMALLAATLLKADSSPSRDKEEFRNHCDTIAITIRSGEVCATNAAALLITHYIYERWLNQNDVMELHRIADLAVEAWRKETQSSPVSERVTGIFKDYI